MKVYIKIYDKMKYCGDSEIVASTTYDNVKSVEVKEIPREEIIKTLDEFDDYDEYVIITGADGTMSTFRNSYTDVFKF